jgi:hypothetical protein
VAAAMAVSRAAANDNQRSIFDDPAFADIYGIGA